MATRASCTANFTQVVYTALWIELRYLKIITYTYEAFQKPGKTIEETSWCVRPERVNKWPNSMLAI
jgi:hypothetical protein